MELRKFIGVSLILLSGVLSSVAAEHENITDLRERFGKDFQENTDCGGTLDASAGLISYKLKEDIPANRTCIWTIVNKHEKQFRLTLLQDGFIDSPMSNFLAILGRSENSFHDTRLLQFAPGERRSFNSLHTILLVAFTSYPPVGEERVPQGFTFVFESSEYKNKSLFYVTPKVLEQDGKEEGVAEYKSDPSLKKPELVRMILRPPPGKLIGLTLETLRNMNENSLPACIYGAMHFVVTELLANHEPYIRLGECKSTTKSVTIYSRSPLIINYLSTFPKDDTQIGKYGFRLSWKTFDE